MTDNTSEGGLGQAARENAVAGLRVGLSDGAARTPQATENEAPTHATSSRGGRLQATNTFEELQPFRVTVPRRVLQRIRERVETAELPVVPFTEDFSYGPPPDYMRSLIDHWLTKYEWREEEKRLNRWPQFRVSIDGEQLHFVRIPGSGNRSPLLMLHGWPYSFGTLLDVAGQIAHPELCGGQAEDGREVVIPSLPGYGFSDRPAAPLDSRTVAGRMYRLMTTALGHERFAVQAGDMGAVVMSWLALDYPSSLAGIHYSNGLVASDSGIPLGVVDPGTGSISAEQRQGVIDGQVGVQRNLGYLFQQGTRPLTVGYWADSPVGAAAWIIDKFYSWSDRRTRPFSSVFTTDQLLNEVMLYLATGTFDSAVWMYYANSVNNTWVPPQGFRVAVPTGVAAFPDPLLPAAPPADVARTFNLIHYTTPPRGGHFPMIEEPSTLVSDVQEFLEKVDVT